MKTIKTIEFDTIQLRLKTLALTQSAKTKADSLSPFLSESKCRQHMQETTEARQIMEWAGAPPLAAMDGLLELMELAHIGAMLTAEQLTDVTIFIAACKRMKSYLKKAEIQQIAIASYSSSFYDLETLSDEIVYSIRNKRVDDKASTSLRDIRRKIEFANTAIKAKLGAYYEGTRNGLRTAMLPPETAGLFCLLKRSTKTRLAVLLLSNRARATPIL